MPRAIASPSPGPPPLNFVFPDECNKHFTGLIKFLEDRIFGCRVNTDTCIVDSDFNLRRFHSVHVFSTYSYRAPVRCKLNGIHN